MISFLLVVILIFLANCISKKLAKKSLEKHGDITNDELKKHGISPDVENISNEKIDEMFDDKEK
jgi:PBP1b-binding outer membrane lipoprotein LpoB